LARANKDFARSDELRDELQKQGFRIEDTEEGYTLHQL
jgi:cysteinyl-tRNA synthetase